MNAEIERLFEAALQIPSEKRAQFLSLECADVEVRREVEVLLEHDGGAETFIAQAVACEAASFAQNLLFSHGQRLGPYRILSVIGRGGMGLVYLAQRADGKFDQRVAIKVVQAGLGGFLAGRLQQECRILASLEHANIARLIDAGATDDGLPYFVMEYVAGQPIDRFCDELKLAPRERVKLMLPVCEAVQFAHQKLVVHRDLKPDNILVTADGIPKLLDFGIAKVIGEAPAATPEAVTRVLTPEYASPEQFRGEMAGTPTDVYSLGGVFYKLLTGATPHQIQGTSPVDTLRAICDQDVRRPSSLRPELGGDLDHILQMALRKEPQRRYSSAEQLAADLRHWLADEPVLASPDTIWYRSGKFIRRHWLGAAAAAIVLVALLTGAGVAAWQARRAERRFEDVRHLANVFLFDFEQSIHSMPGATKARQLVVKTALEYLRSLSREAAGDPALMHELAAAYEKVGDIQGNDETGNVDDAPGAVRSYQKAISLIESSQGWLSGNVGLRSNLAQVLVKLAGVQVKTRQLKAAVESGQQAASVDQAVLQSHPTDRVAAESLAEAYALLAFLNGRDSHTSMDYAQRGLSMRESLAAKAPQDRRAQRSLADGYLSVGNLSEMLQRSPVESVGYYEKALPIFERLSAQDPADADVRRMLMVVLAELGEMQLRGSPNPRTIGQMPLANLRRAYAMADNAVTIDPANARAVTDLVAMCARLANSLGVLGRGTEGERIMERAVQAASDLARRDQASGENRLDLGKVHSQFADLLAKNARMPDAIRHRRIAAEIYAKMAAVNPADSKVRLLQVWNWSSLGDLLAKQGDLTGARSSYALGREVAEVLAPGNPAFADALAVVRRADLRVTQALGNRR